MKSLYIFIGIVIVIIIGWLVFSRKAPEPVVSVSPTPSATPTPDPVFTLMSSAFVEGASIPAQFTCDGANTQPPLSWDNAPTGTQSFALTMVDPDVPKPVHAEGYFNHWEVFNIASTTSSLTASTTAGILGNNSSGKASYTGPCPPVKYEPKEHRYIFTLYALDSMLTLKKGATRAQLEKAVEGHVLATTTLMGRYESK